MDSILTYPDRARPDEKLVENVVEFCFNLIVAFFVEYGIELLIELLLSFFTGF